MVVDVDVENTVFCGIAGTTAYLTEVRYQSTTLDDGHTIDTTSCVEEDSVGPVDEPYIVTDTGPFECATYFDWNGPSTILNYE